MFKRILWATDFSEHATRAREWAVDCARCSQGKLFALVVVDVADVPVLADVVTPEVSQANLAEAEAWTEARLAEVAQGRLAREITDIRATGVEAEPVVRIGVPWREILAAAEELGIDMIVFGSHGKHGLKTLVLGNTVENVTRRAPCPVMIIR
ncbi:MAG: universal stress protein [Anaerolineae bacterium]|nr:universal stress protein [Anaerolineae bacterium]